MSRSNSTLRGQPDQANGILQRARPTLVSKYGGSSVANAERLRAVAERIARSHTPARAHVVVVSAMGDTTSRLLDQAGAVNDDPGHRELDLLLATGEQQSASLLALCLQQLGLPATALTGPQAGVRTCGTHLNARIESVDAGPIQALLDRGHIVVVAGFQGAGPDGELTTLGRGGSDTTAVAIAAALRAVACEICSDVDGVYSADPRVVDDAVRLARIGLRQMKSFAHHGAHVLNEAAIDHALRHRVAIHARCSRGRPGETIVCPDSLASRAVIGVASQRRLLGLHTEDAALHQALRRRLAGYRLFLPQAAWQQGQWLLLPAAQLSDEAALCQSLRSEFGADLTLNPELASVSLIGGGRESDAASSRLAEQLLQAQGLAATTWLRTEHALCALLPRAQAAAACRAWHEGFRIAEREVADVA